MSEGGRNPTISISCSGGSKLNRTPSRDSVATDVSLTSCIESRFSMRTAPTAMDQKTQNLRVSFRTGNLPLSRGISPSPCLSDRLVVPSPSNRPSSPGVTSIKDIWLDDENDLIRSCGAISKALGLQKSFSTSDIQTNPDNSASLRNSRSEAFLQDALCLHWGKLEPNSRSLSTWVAVGDVQSSTSQLPSPQVELSKGFPESVGANTQFTAADFVRSVNKSVRQNYIKRRLKVTYKAIEQLSESGFDLDKLEKSVKSAPNKFVNQTKPKSRSCGKASKGLAESVQKSLGNIGIPESSAPVSTKEIERDRGKPISKFERNIMIFDWLHTLDESATIDVNSS